MDMKEAAALKLQGIDAEGREKTFSLGDFAGRELVLYFYPKDHTSGCTQEACDFRDNMNRLTSRAAVVGVSPDSLESHRKFQTEHGLNFPLLSDPNHTLAELFGAWGEKSMYGRKYMGIIRSTFLIGPDGQIRHSWPKVKVKGHVDDVLKVLGEQKA
jgi:peroxiredoxin Q/BCP